MLLLVALLDEVNPTLVEDEPESGTNNIWLERVTLELEDAAVVLTLTMREVSDIVTVIFTMVRWLFH